MIGGFFYEIVARRFDSSFRQSKNFRATQRMLRFAGKGWGRKHSTVDYVFQHPYYQLFSYHKLVMDEMIKRGMKPSDEWLDSNYRGKLIGCDNSSFTQSDNSYTLYAEHNNDYLEECTQNLKVKGFEILI